MQEIERVTYINIMLDSLKKKDTILTKLLNETKKQSTILAGDSVDFDVFNETLKNKEEYLNELQVADKGFLDMYNRVKEVLEQNTADYKLQVSEAKELVKRQMEMSVELQTLEEKNKNRLALHLSNGKQKIKDFKVSSRSVAAYYKNMTNKHQEGDSYFLDRKK